MVRRSREFWQRSYKSDPVAFVLELVSFVFTVAASTLLATTAADPNMLLVYPGFFVGSVTQCYASYRRGAAWVMMLTAYFSIINVIGFLIAGGVL